MEEEEAAATARTTAVDGLGDCVMVLGVALGSRGPVVSLGAADEAAEGVRVVLCSLSE
jgi:hypothetical protein